MTTIKTLRSEDIFESLSAAIDKLNTKRPKAGEIFSVFYTSQDSKVNVVSAVGLGNGNYRIITTIPFSIVLDILDHDPGSGNRDNIVWTDGTSWYYCDNPVEEPILCRDANSNYLTLTTSGPKYWADTWSESELQENCLDTLVKIQADWNETNNTNPRYIENKPQNLSDFDEDILYSFEEIEPGIYALLENGERVQGDLIETYPNNTIISGRVEEDGTNFNLIFTFFDSHEIQIPLYPISKNYVPGPGINLESGELSVNTNLLNTRGEISIGEEYLFRKEDKEKLDQINDTLLRAEELESGKIQPKEVEFGKSVKRSEADNIISTTKGWDEALRITAGGECGKICPGKAQLLELYGNIGADELISTSWNAVIYESGFILKDTMIISNTLVVRPKPNNTVYFFYAIPGRVYKIGLKENYQFHVYGTSRIPRLWEAVNEEIFPSEPGCYTLPSNYSIIVIWVVGDYSNTLYATLNHEKYKDVRYRKSVLPLNTPTGIRGTRYKKIGDTEVYDRWFSDENNLLCYEQKYGLISVSDWGPYNSIEINDIKPGTEFIIAPSSDIWVEDKTIKTSDPFILGDIYYELETPITFSLGVSASYDVWDYGTECLANLGGDEVSYFPSDINNVYWKAQYPEDLDKTLLDIPDILNSTHILDLNVGLDNQVSSTSEDMVSGKAIKDYIDTIVHESLGSVKDLSMYNVFGSYKVNLGKETANSYTVYEPGNYKFPLVYGNAIRGGRENTSSFMVGSSYSFFDYTGNIIYDPYIPVDSSCTASIVWTDSPNCISGLSIQMNQEDYTFYLYFRVNKIPELNGNTVIAVKDVNNNIIWSWHIWLLQDKLEVQSIEEYGLDLLSENLGTIWDYSGSNKYGTALFYQWGRKDPFPGSTNSHSTSSRAQIETGSGYSIANSIKNPLKFYTDYSLPSTPGDKMWNTSNYSSFYFKSIYDPCPPGCFVASENVPKVFTTTETSSRDPNEFNIIGSWDCGFVFKYFDDDEIGSYYPALGRRVHNTGAINGTGTVGYYWFAGRLCLDFGNSDLYFSTSDVRTGCMIRPQIELNYV